MSDPFSASDPRLAPPDVGLLTVAEAARFLRIGRNTCYELIRQGQIPHIRLGRLIRVPRFGLEERIASAAGVPQPTPPVVTYGRQRH